MISVVLFDLDDTLFAHSAAVAHGVAAHRRALGLLGDEAAEFARWSALEEQHYHRYLRGEVGYLEMRRARARAFVEPFGIDLADDAVADDWFGGYLARYRTGWEFYDDAWAVLDLLPQRLGIITNAELAFQLGKLDALEVAGRFEHVVASGEVGYAKPDERIFHAAVAAFGVAPSAAAYIGDRLHTDAIGASDAGLLGVWIARGGASTLELSEAESHGVAVIRSLLELPALLAAHAEPR